MCPGYWSILIVVLLVLVIIFLSDTVEIVRDVICALQCGAWLCCVAANYFRYQHFLIRCILREK